LTQLLPDGDIVPIFDAVLHYAEEGTGLVILAGRDYGSGSSRDTAAKASYLAGVKAVIAQSFERIHRSNLINMGIWPLAFYGTDTIDTLGIADAVSFSITSLPMLFAPQKMACVTTTLKDGRTKLFDVVVKIATSGELNTLLSGGLLIETLSAALADTDS